MSYFREVRILKFRVIIDTLYFETETDTINESREWIAKNRPEYINHRSQSAVISEKDYRWKTAQ